MPFSGIEHDDSFSELVSQGKLNGLNWLVILSCGWRLDTIDVLSRLSVVSASAKMFLFVPTAVWVRNFGAHGLIYGGGIFLSVDTLWSLLRAVFRLDKAFCQLTGDVIMILHWR
jgi:hypothetical protein